MSKPDWIISLQAACNERTQAAVSLEIGYSKTVVSQVLNGVYPGDLGAVEQAVKGALMNAVVECPVLGEMRMDACLENQRKPFKPINHISVSLFSACQICANNRKNQEGQS